MVEAESFRKDGAFGLVGYRYRVREELTAACPCNIIMPVVVGICKPPFRRKRNLLR